MRYLIRRHPLSPRPISSLLLASRLASRLTVSPDGSNRDTTPSESTTCLAYLPITLHLIGSSPASHPHATSDETSDEQPKRRTGTGNRRRDKENTTAADTANAPPSSPYSPYEPHNARTLPRTRQRENDPSTSLTTPQTGRQRNDGRDETRRTERYTALLAYRCDDETPPPACLPTRATERPTPRRTATRPTTRQHGTTSGTMETGSGTGREVERKKTGRHSTRKAARKTERDMRFKREDCYSSSLSESSGKRGKIKETRTIVFILFPSHRNLRRDTGG